MTPQSDSVLQRSVTSLDGKAPKQPQKSTQEAYLHVIRGGYNDVLRKKVRKLFSEGTTPQSDDFDDSDFDLLVGILEEIRAVGINTFTVAHVRKIAIIFELLSLTSTNALDIDQFVAAALTRLRIPCDGETYHLPDSLESLQKRYCTVEKLEARKTQFETRKVQTQ
jgi:hypothetical protein